MNSLQGQWPIETSNFASSTGAHSHVLLITLTLLPFSVRELESELQAFLILFSLEEVVTSAYNLIEDHNKLAYSKCNLHLHVHAKQG